MPRVNNGGGSSRDREGDPNPSSGGSPNAGSPNDSGGGGSSGSSPDQSGGGIVQKARERVTGFLGGGSPDGKAAGPDETNSTSASGGAEGAIDEVTDRVSEAADTVAETASNVADTVQSGQETDVGMGIAGGLDSESGVERTADRIRDSATEPASKVRASTTPSSARGVARQAAATVAAPAILAAQGVTSARNSNIFEGEVSSRASAGDVGLRDVVSDPAGSLEAIQRGEEIVSPEKTPSEEDIREWVRKDPSEIQTAIDKRTTGNGTTAVGVAGARGRTLTEMEFATAPGPLGGMGAVGAAKRLPSLVRSGATLSGSGTRVAATGSDVARAVGRYGQFAAEGTEALIRAGGIAGIGTVASELPPQDPTQDVTEIEPGELTPPKEVGQPERPVENPPELEPSEPLKSEIETPDEPSRTDPRELTTQQMLQEGDVYQFTDEEMREVAPEDIEPNLGEPDQPGPSVREQIRRNDLYVSDRNFPTGEDAVAGRPTSVEEPQVDATPGVDYGPEISPDRFSSVRPRDPLIPFGDTRSQFDREAEQLVGPDVDQEQPVPPVAIPQTQTIPEVAPEVATEQQTRTDTRQDYPNPNENRFRDDYAYERPPPTETGRAGRPPRRRFDDDEEDEFIEEEPEGSLYGEDWVNPVASANEALDETLDSVDATMDETLDSLDDTVEGFDDLLPPEGGGR